MKKLSTASILRACALAAGSLILTSFPAHAQSNGYSILARPKPQAPSDDTSGSYRAFLVSLPVVTVGSGMTGRLELNLYGRASIALEGSYEPRSEDLPKKQVDLTGESLTTQGRDFVVFLNRYTRPYTLSGFYYGLGVGYRQENLAWKERTGGASLAFTDAAFATHDLVAQGPTGHARVGFRYVGSEIPLLIGIYGGARHFQATYVDRTTGVPETVVPTTDAEKDHLKRRFETAPEAGIEVGFAI